MKKSERKKEAKKKKLICSLIPATKTNVRTGFAGFHNAAPFVYLMSLSNCPTFASIGSLIIDDIVYKDGRKAHNVLGGAGVFAIYGIKYNSYLSNKNTKFAFNTRYETLAAK